MISQCRPIVMSMNRHRGIALVVVLWTVSLLSILAGGLSYSLRQETRLTANYVEDAKAQALVEGGIYYGIQMLFSEDEQSRWARDGREYEINLAGHSIFVSLQDERGKLDINTASEKLILHMIGYSAGEVDAQAITQSILDWRDKDHTRHPQGAEDDDYMNEQFAYGVRDSAFLVIEEVQQVMGMTAAVYADISGLITVYSRSSGVDPETAAVDVLARLPGMGRDLAEQYILSRAEAVDKNAGLLSNSLPAETQAYLVQDGPAVYTVTGRVQLPHGGSVEKSAIVHFVGQQGEPYSIVAWRNSNGAMNTDKTDFNEQ